ncbi:hypothetical protein BZL29_3647 [Mycobacterium kansasii]|uniref:Uncharacterized protein n=1 Tax=Mycobacterium kansasii TaxID=1768 RepID=A0A1V3XD40_MYCKA|nr:hypothetical protein BZL29_3647 [Mycobacterium kansasii]
MVWPAAPAPQAGGALRPGVAVDRVSQSHEQCGFVGSGVQARVRSW